MLERYLRQHGLNGNPYRLGFGDLKQIKRMTMDAQSKPINVSDDIIPHVVPFHHHIIQKYGTLHDFVLIDIFSFLFFFNSSDSFNECWISEGNE
jgi:hypothetical protein